MWMEGMVHHYLSIRSDKPDDYFSDTTSQVSMVDFDSVVFTMNLPQNERPGAMRIWMRSEDFMVVQIQDAAPFYFKRCPAGERIS
jgi:hypothetical protein